MTPRPKLCILFLHHNDDAVTRHHFRLLRRSNPDAWIVPVVDAPRGALPGAVDVSLCDSPWNTTDKWRSCDTMVYRWFRQRKADADRYIVIEYDCRVDVDLLEYYGPWLDADVVVASWKDRERQPDWDWFREIARLSDEDRPAAAGVVPLAGVMFTHDALVRTSAIVTTGDIFCDLRLGTAIRRAGLKVRELSGASRRRLGWREYPRFIWRPGFYHPVKAVHHNWRFLGRVPRILLGSMRHGGRIQRTIRRLVGRPA